MDNKRKFKNKNRLALRKARVRIIIFNSYAGDCRKASANYQHGEVMADKYFQVEAMNDNTLRVLV
jgi:hypothetical protein